MNAAATIPLGPYCEVDLGDLTLPLWLVPFDRAGKCTGRQTRERLVEDIAESGYTDVFLFSHGWNNTFDQATANYRHFITGYHKFIRSQGLRSPSPCRPLLVGIYWPSVDLILPWETAPRIAGAPGGAVSDEIDWVVRDTQQSLDRKRRERFQDLAAARELPEAQARELAELLARVCGDDHELQTRPPPDADEMMWTWSQLREAGLTSSEAESPGPESFTLAAEDRIATGPKAAGKVFSSVVHFDPRDILRAFTVYRMKDRAGLVGAGGGSLLLRDLLRASDKPRLHLVGHSYGCRLLLAAVCAQPLPRKVRSLLLLEPAVNYLCFARQVPTLGRPGGFRPALKRVEEPILSTFSSHDVALHDFFHIAVRRRSDLGELKVATPGVAPSIYAALGGWGPGGLDPDEATEVPLARFPDRYELDGSRCRMYALNGESGITSHSDVSNEWTYWALYNQVTA